MQKSQIHPSSKTLYASNSLYLSTSPLPPSTKSFRRPHSTYSKNQKLCPPQTQFQQLMSQQFSHYVQIFTDGSKSDLGVGAALWILSLPRHYSFSLPSFKSIFHVEQVAIYQTLLFIKENFTVGYFLIISDSLSALQSIQTLRSKRAPHCLS